MALKPADKSNFETLRRAFSEDAVSLVECADIKTGEYRAVLCAVNPDGGGYVLIPFGHLCTDNPFETYTPPS